MYDGKYYTIPDSKFVNRTEFTYNGYFYRIDTVDTFREIVTLSIYNGDISAYIEYDYFQFYPFAQPDTLLHTYFVEAHGQSCQRETGGLEYFILPDNVLVVMNCNSTTSYLKPSNAWNVATNEVFEEAINMYTNLDVKVQYVNSLVDMLADNFEICVFTQKCPNVLLEFQDTQDIMGIFKLPAPRNYDMPAYIQDSVNLLKGIFVHQCVDDKISRSDYSIVSQSEAYKECEEIKPETSSLSKVLTLKSVCSYYGSQLDFHVLIVSACRGGLSTVVNDGVKLNKGDYSLLFKKLYFKLFGYNDRLLKLERRVTVLENVRNQEGGHRKPFHYNYHVLGKNRKVRWSNTLHTLALTYQGKVITLEEALKLDEKAQRLKEKEASKKANDSNGTQKERMVAVREGAPGRGRAH